MTCAGWPESGCYRCIEPIPKGAQEGPRINTDKTSVALGKDSHFHNLFHQFGRLNCLRQLISLNQGISWGLSYAEPFDRKTDSATNVAGKNLHWLSNCTVTLILCHFLLIFCPNYSYTCIFESDIQSLKSEQMQSVFLIYCLVFDIVYMSSLEGFHTGIYM